MDNGNELHAHIIKLKDLLHLADAMQLMVNRDQEPMIDYLMGLLQLEIGSRIIQLTDLDEN